MKLLASCWARVLACRAASSTACARCWAPLASEVSASRRSQVSAPMVARLVAISSMTSSTETNCSSPIAVALTMSSSGASATTNMKRHRRVSTTAPAAAMTKYHPSIGCIRASASPGAAIGSSRVAARTHATAT